MLHNNLFQNILLPTPFNIFSISSNIAAALKSFLLVAEV